MEISNDNPLIIFDDDGTPSRADARRNRKLLLETAQALFEANGVDAVSMTAIADAADVGKGTLYRHFPNKAALCNALLDEDMHALQMDV
ncbi:MAG: helix-turn-helix domain-containing protein, partial [Pseudomonadota bacterium]